MIGENYQKVNETLRLVLELSPARRQKALADMALQPEVRAEVEALLEAEDKMDDFMSLSISDFSKDILELSNEPLAGQKIDNYEIIRELGSGGMGAVYLARRADGKFEQTVALKMLRREFNVEQIRRHFRRESEIQAKLEHPNIARLLDVGTTEDGVPFIVMEYIDAVRVDEFCRERSLSTKETLKLFNKVCQAVAHAHHHLIVHRDLKPSNILITESGEPKLLDFGISKLLDENDLKEKTGLTALGAMTPEYASPEQLRGESVSTATDIYSLGMVLCKMLTGELPFKTEGLKNGELLKFLAESEPLLPSTIAKFGSNGVRGDVDNIILKALRKEPEQRYGTVEEFSADVWRHLDGLPVEARPPTVAYKAGKFFQRNRISVIAAAFVLLSLVGGAAVALWQAREARAQAAFAVESRGRSEAEREKAEKVTGFLFKVFGYGNPAWFAEGAKFGGNTRVIEAMEDLSGQIDVEFAGQADVQAELHHKFAEAFSWSARSEKDESRKAFLIQKAHFHLMHGLELRKQFYGEWHELVAKDLYYNLGNLGKTDAEQAAILMNAIEMMRATNPSNLNLAYMLQDYSRRLAAPDLAEKHEVYLNAVRPATNENKYQLAERFLREALPIFRAHYKQDNHAIRLNECRLAYALIMQGKDTSSIPSPAQCRDGEPGVRNDE